MTAKERVGRANGEASRRRILDAAAQIAGERGYAGTSINDVSARSGLPKSSIYWHFTDKDGLFAAVIEDSYEQWRAEFAGDASAGTSTSPRDVLVRLHDSLAGVPAFLRFGQLVVLEQHESELTARARFLAIRTQALVDLAAVFERVGLSADEAAQAAAVALALVDGASLSRAAGETGLDDSTILGDVLDAYVRRVQRR